MNVPQDIQSETHEFRSADVYLDAGADYVISSIDELRELIKIVNSRLVLHETTES